MKRGAKSGIAEFCGFAEVLLTHDVSAGVRPQELNVHWRGHAFLFEKKRAPKYGATGGLRLLLIFFTLEGVIGPRLWLFSWFHVPLPPVWLRVPILLGLALLLVRFVAGLKLSEIGLYRWREWSATEKSYFVQVFLIANLVFSVLFADRLRVMLAEPHLLRSVGTVFLPYLLWGFYQEVAYRGILQTELVRRWGPPARDSCQQFSLHLWSVALLPLLAHSPCSTDVRWHFRHRLVLRGVVQEIGQFVDGCHLSWHRQLIYRGHSSALIADGIGCRRLRARVRSMSQIAWLRQLSGSTQFSS